MPKGRFLFQWTSAGQAKGGCNAVLNANTFASAMDYGTNVVGGTKQNPSNTDSAHKSFQEQTLRKQDKHISGSQSLQALPTV